MIKEVYLDLRLNKLLLVQNLPVKPVRSRNPSKLAIAK